MKRELRLRGKKAIELAQTINDYPQTINAVMKERRGVNPKLSIKLGNYFDVAPDYFRILQASYKVTILSSKNKLYKNKSFPKFRNAIFWDTDVSKIDWQKSKSSVIRRVFERGNRKEIDELTNYYGDETVVKELARFDNSFLPDFEEHVERILKKQLV